jgi:hypothetical protein
MSLACVKCYVCNGFQEPVIFLVLLFLFPFKKIVFFCKDSCFHFCCSATELYKKNMFLNLNNRQNCIDAYAFRILR